MDTRQTFSLRSPHKTTPPPQRPVEADTWVCRCAFVVLGALILAAGCAKTPQDPNDPEHPVWNPIDSHAPPGMRATPRATITGGPVQDGVVFRDSVTFTWKGNDSSVVAYCPCLDGACEPAFGPATSKMYANLEEGSHEFHVLARYPTGLETPLDSAEKRRFVVDALGTAIYLSPRAQTVGFEQDFAFEIKAKRFARVDTQRVKGVRLLVGLPGGMTCQLDTLGFLNRGTSRVLWWKDDRMSTVLLEMAVVGEPPTTPADSGSIARIRLHSGRTAFTDSVRVLECEVFNGNNNLLQGVATRGARLEVR